MAATNAVDGKVAAIQREYPPCLCVLSGNNQRGVGEIHRLVPILVHQLERSLECAVGEEPHAQALFSANTIDTVRPRKRQDRIRDAIRPLLDET